MVDLALASMHQMSDFLAVWFISPSYSYSWHFQYFVPIIYFSIQLRVLMYRLDTAHFTTTLRGATPYDP